MTYPYFCTHCDYCCNHYLIDWNKMPIDTVSYLYAATVAAGGIFGYVKAGETFNRIYFPFRMNISNQFSILGSIPSLCAGLAFGSILGKVF